MPEGQRFLVICHTFPPYQGIGGRRWAKFSKALATKGHEVHVVCSAGSTEMQGSLWTADIASPRIIVHELPQHYPTVLFKRPLTTLADKLGYRFWMKVMPMLVKGNWFDKAILWEKQLIALSDRLIRTHGIRNVIVTGAPFSLMTHALRLRELHPGIQLIADFRDPWTWTGGYGFPSLSTARQERERSLEAQAVRSFDQVISPASGIIEHLLTTYGGPASKYHVVPHAFDPDDLAALPQHPDDGSFRMVFAGNVYDPGVANGFFKALFDGLGHLRSARPDLFVKTRLDILITDGEKSAYEADAERRGLASQVHFHDPLPPREFFKLVAMADLALVFSTSFNKDFLGTKFSELFYLRKPVLHIGEAGVVSRTIAEKRLGASVKLDELPVELPRFISGERSIDLDRNADITTNRLDVVTDQLLELMG